MSNTIRPRDPTRQTPVLLQKRPDYIIDEAERFYESTSPYVPLLIYKQKGIGISDPKFTTVVGMGAIVTEVARDYATVPSSGIAWATALPSSLGGPGELQLRDEWTRWTAQVKEALQSTASNMQRNSTAAAQLRVRRLVKLQAAFGFTTLDLAAVLAISRQQLYKWFDAESDVKLHEANRMRLGAVERIAERWMSRSQIPLSSLSRDTLASGANVFTMLSLDTLDESTIVGAFDELEARIADKPRTRTQRLRDAGFTRRKRLLPPDE